MQRVQGKMVPYAWRNGLECLEEGAREGWRQWTTECWEKWAREAWEEWPRDGWEERATILHAVG